MALNPKQCLFVEHYIQCWNGAEAARKAGYSVERADVTASELKRNPEVQAAIKERLSEAAMTADETLHHLAEIARGTYAEHYEVDSSGRVATYNLAECIKAGRGRLLRKVKPTQYGYEIEFLDRLAALDKLARHHKLLTDKVDLSLESLSDEELIARATEAFRGGGEEGGQTSP